MAAGLVRLVHCDLNGASRKKGCVSAKQTDQTRVSAEQTGGKADGRPGLPRRLAALVYRVLRHPRLRTKLLVGVLAGIVLASAVQFVISYRGTMGNLSELENKRMSENLQVAVNIVEHNKLDLEQMANDYGSPTVARHVVARDQRWLEKNVLTRLSDLRNVPLVMVLDREAKPIVGTEWADSSILDEPVALAAVQGVGKVDYATWDDRIWMLAGSPIMSGGRANKAVGLLLVGRPVDDGFAALIKRATNTEIAFMLDKKVTATTDTALTPLIEDSESRGASLVEEGADVAVVGGYGAVKQRLGVPGVESWLVVAASREPIVTAQRELLRDSFIAALFALGIGVFIAVLLSRQLGRPIAHLTTVARQIAAAATIETQRRLPETARGKPRKRGAKKAAKPPEAPAIAAETTPSERLDRGLHEARVPVSARRRDEVNDLGRAFNDMVEQVELAQETLRRMAVRDGLTGLLNHREFFERLRTEIAKADREGTTLSMLMIDLDLFKKVNDTHGHLAGDALLTELSRMIEAQVREYDVVARYAGDEFAVILPRTDTEQASAIGERVRAGTDGLPQAAGLPGSETITVSVGVVTRKPKQRAGDVYDEAKARRRAELEARRTVELADTALYRAKNGGRDRVEIQEPVV